MKKVILDCDTGSDDAFAIALGLLNENVNLIGITCGWGNLTVDEVVNNTLKMVQACGKRTPVYRGCAHSLLKLYDCRCSKDKENIISYFKEDGTEVCLHPRNFDLPMDLKVQKEHACTYLVNTLLNSKDKITLVVVGPATNIAVALSMEPRIVENIEEIVFMGGSVGMGNVSASAEANFWNDPEAIRIILHSGAKIRIVPLNATHAAAFDLDIENLFASTNEFGKFLAYLIHNRVDVSKKLGWGELSGYVIHDGLAMALVIDETIAIDMRKQKCEIDTSINDSTGTLTVEDDEASNIEILYLADRQKYINLILSAIHKLD